MKYELAAIVCAIISGNVDRFGDGSNSDVVMATLFGVVMVFLVMSIVFMLLGIAQ